MAKKICPLLKKGCIEHKCMWWKDLVFTKQTDGESTSIVVWDCAINWTHKIQIEHGKDVRQTAASMDKMSNETNAAAGSILMRLIGRQGLVELEDKG